MRAMARNAQRDGARHHASVREDRQSRLNHQPLDGVDITMGSGSNEDQIAVAAVSSALEGHRGNSEDSHHESGVTMQPSQTRAERPSTTASVGPFDPFGWWSVWAVPFHPSSNTPAPASPRAEVRVGAGSRRPAASAASEVGVAMKAGHRATSSASIRSPSADRPSRTSDGRRRSLSGRWRHGIHGPTPSRA